MPMTTLQNLVDLAKNRIDELDIDTQIDNIIQEGINFAYVFKTDKIEPEYSTTIGVVINGLVSLPSDLLSIEKITPSLNGDDKKKGLTLIVSEDDGTTFTIVYKASRSPLILTDTVDCSDKLKYLLTTYGCYAYQQYRKRQPIAQIYLDEFNTGISEMEFDAVTSDLDTAPNEVTDAIFVATTDDNTVAGNW